MYINYVNIWYIRKRDLNSLGPYRRNGSPRVPVVHFLAISCVWSYKMKHTLAYLLRGFLWYFWIITLLIIFGWPKCTLISALLDFDSQFEYLSPSNILLILWLWSDAFTFAKWFSPLKTNGFPIGMTFETGVGCIFDVPKTKTSYFSIGKKAITCVEDLRNPFNFPLSTWPPWSANH